MMEASWNSEQSCRFGTGAADPTSWLRNLGKVLEVRWASVSLLFNRGKNSYWQSCSDDCTKEGFWKDVTGSSAWAINKWKVILI